MGCIDCIPKRVPTDGYFPGLNGSGRCGYRFDPPNIDDRIFNRWLAGLGGRHPHQRVGQCCPVNSLIIEG